MNAIRCLIPASILFLSSLLLHAADRVSNASSGKAPTPGDVVLFPFDDDGIPWRENLKVTLQQPAKYPGNPVMKAGAIDSVNGYGMLLYGTVIKVGQTYKMWYLSTPRADNQRPGDVELLKWWRPVSYAESKDGIHWILPNLGLVDFRGNKNNNIVRIDPSTSSYAHSYDFIAVWYEPEDPDAGRRYKMAYIVLDEKRKSGATATAVSPDGLSWKLLNTEPIQQGHFENTGLLKFAGLYYLSGQNIPPHDAGLMDGSAAGRVMKVFFSPDFNHWSSGRALAWYRSDYTTEPTNRGHENHMGAGLWNRGNVVVGFYGRWQGDTIQTQPGSSLSGLKVDLGMVISNDAIHYREPVRNFVMVPHGAATDWDSNAILEANAFANTDTQTLIWYSHWYTNRLDTIPALPAKLDELNTQKADAIGLLMLPRDRFGYFSKQLSRSQGRNKALDRPIEASCLTRSLKFSRPAQLYVNIDDLRSDAPLDIALVDDAERPLAGYTAKLRSNALKAPVQWASKRSLPLNQAFRVRITWPAGTDEGKLYTIYIEQN
jgi:hypothetical protein